MPDKAALRLRLRGTLARLSADAKSAASAQLCRQLTSWPRFQQASVIALFHPTLTEPDLLPLLRLPGKTFLFPLCHRDRRLTWHPPDNLDQWQPGRFGIIEPDPSLSPAVPASTIHLVIVPGLAFTRAGDRLGHGAGYYDRFLAALPPDTLTAGACFDCQLQEQIPTQAHDIRVQQVFHA